MGSTPTPGKIMRRDMNSKYKLQLRGKPGERHFAVMGFFYRYSKKLLGPEAASWSDEMRVKEAELKIEELIRAGTHPPEGWDLASCSD